MPLGHAVAHIGRLQRHETGGNYRTARRSINLDPSTVDVLRRWRRHCEREDPDFDRDDLDGHVFCRPDGALTHPQLLSDAFKKLVRRSRLPRIRLHDHDLRHTHATLLLEAGVPIKVVSERLGHSTPGFAMAIYQHVSPGMQKEAA